MESLGRPRPADRVLHFAPEHGLSRRIHDAVGSKNYVAYDLVPKDIGHCTVGAFDLCKDVVGLESESFDLIVHSHVMEHVPCNYAVVLMHLHRALTPDGLHVCIIPTMPGHYEEHLGEMEPEERTRRFGQSDHVRRFGVDHLQATLGMLFNMPGEYDLENRFPTAILEEYNIPRYASRGFTPNTVLTFRKADIKV